MRLLVVLAVAVLLAGCGAEAPATVPFTRVDLPAGAVPARIAADGNDLIVAFRRDGRPGILRYANGRMADIPLVPATPYGAEASWFSLATDGHEILAVGGRAGGAHSNVRWSVWRTDGAGIAEQPQKFSTFGGYGAGSLVDGVVPAGGSPVLVGVWQGATVGSDVTLWTTDGTAWNRQSSADTPLESTEESLKFPLSATAHGADVVIAGWQLTGGRQQPVVWTLRAGVATLTPLPDAGRSGMAITVSCEDTCAVAGRVDGRLAIWRQTGNAWRRVADVPDVPVGDDDRPMPPLGDTLLFSSRLTVRVATLGGDVRDAAGPTGVVTAVARVGDSVYALAGPDKNNQTLWRVGSG